MAGTWHPGAPASSSSSVQGSDRSQLNQGSGLSLWSRPPNKVRVFPDLLPFWKARVAEFTRIVKVPCPGLACGNQELCFFLKCWDWSCGNLMGVEGKVCYYLSLNYSGYCAGTRLINSKGEDYKCLHLEFSNCRWLLPTILQWLPFKLKLHSFCEHSF